MTWNYRVIRHVENREEYFTVHECYYDNNGEPEMISTEPVYPYGSTPEELLAEVERYKAAFNLPILDYSLFASKQK